MPSQIFQCLHIAGIAAYVARQLTRPIAKIGFWGAAVLTCFFGMLMPKAAVDENHFLSCSEHQVGLARKIIGMQPETITYPVDE